MIERTVMAAAQMVTVVRRLGILKYVWTALRAAVMGLAVAALTMAQLSLPDKDFWPHLTPLLYGCVGLVVIVEVAERLPGRSLSPAERTYTGNVRATLNGGLKDTVDTMGVAWDRVGVHAFVARRRLFSRRLVKVGGVRVGKEPTLTRSDWRPGKGVIGKAWNTEDLEAVDWQDVVRLARTGGRATWAGCSRAITFGLSWPEIQATFDYQGIVACPFYMRNRLAGCVTVDAPLTAEQMCDDGMARILNEVALGVAQAGIPPRAVLDQQ